MPTLALRITASTLAGTLHGVPELMSLLQQYNAGATFLFAMGPDRSGRALKRLVTTKASRHYTAASLLYGTALPSPDIGKRGVKVMRSARDAGFEVGVQGWDTVAWHDQLREADCDWTQTQMEQAMTRFAEVFNQPAMVQAAPDWQMNRHALRLSERFGLRYASDCRGTHPFMPVWDGEIVGCPQLPTTLPTLLELMHGKAESANQSCETLLQLTQPTQQPKSADSTTVSNTADTMSRDHVFAVQAEVEGRKLFNQFEKLILGWQGQGYTLTSLETYFNQLSTTQLPTHTVQMGAIDAHHGLVAKQGKAFLH
jgi:undecaprenyl phosphate-alpha-L-ara4FN deformylase